MTFDNWRDKFAHERSISASDELTRLLRDSVERTDLELRLTADRVPEFIDRRGEHVHEDGRQIIPGEVLERMAHTVEHEMGGRRVNNASMWDTDNRLFIRAMGEAYEVTVSRGGRNGLVTSIRFVRQPNGYPPVALRP